MAATDVTDKVFFIDVEFPTIELKASEIWPNGDAPENPTAEDVKAAMEAYGPWRHVRDDWNLIDGDPSVTVSEPKGRSFAEVWD